MASYYKRYIKDFSQIVAPLVLMTKKDELYQWGPKYEKAFEAIKKLLAIEPILTLPNEIDPFILAMNFSYEGMGLVFSQLQNGKERVIGYYSKTLNQAKKKYGSIKEECATIVWAVAKVR